MSKGLKIDWIARVDAIGPQVAERAAAADVEGRFIAENYAELAEAGLIAAAVPHELGGGGASHSEICEMLRRLAHYCGSTALALSMHQHLVGVTVWKYLRDQPGEALLRRVASEQIVLVSTGAGDWLESNGEVTRVEGGYRVSALKRFASGSPAGDLLITSAAYDDPEKGPSVLHFPVPMNAAGVSIAQDWDTLGMRATGSNTVKLANVFVPEQAIALQRPRQGWHPVWNVVLTVAAPIYCAPYVGVAERAAEIARDVLKQRWQADPEAERKAATVPYLLGEMENALLQARLAHEAAIASAKNYDFSPSIELANQALQTKTLISNAVRTTVDKAMEAVGGAAFFRRLGLERLWRDVRGSAFHPLPEKAQQLITGRLALGLDPV